MSRSAHRLFLLPAATLSFALALAAPAPAQQQRQSLGRIEAWMCAKADVDGDTFRPGFCDARCDCFQPSSITSVTSCSETAPGTFEATYLDTSGTCGDVCSPHEPSGGTFACKGSSSYDYCLTSCSDPLETCVLNSGGISGDCIQLCSSDAECTESAAFCENAPAIACLAQSDCPPGSSCADYDTGGVLHCSPISCAQNADCDLQFVKLELAGVTTPDDTAAVSCSETLPHVSPTGSTINSVDALECITQIEATLGQPCTPSP